MNQKLIRAGVFLTTFSGLVFEIGLTRIYSASIWYHFAFVALSIALLGWGLGGMVVHLFKRETVLTMEHAAAAAILYGFSLYFFLVGLARVTFVRLRWPEHFLPPRGALFI